MPPHIIAIMTLSTCSNLLEKTHTHTRMDTLTLHIEFALIFNVLCVIAFEGISVRVCEATISVLIGVEHAKKKHKEFRPSDADIFDKFAMGRRAVYFFANCDP